MKMSILSTKPSNITFLLFFILIVQGCQTVNDPIIVESPTVNESYIELTPMEKIHQSDNLYLTNKTVVTSEVQQKFENATHSIKKQRWVLATKQLLDITILAPTLSGPWLLLGDIAITKNNKPQAIAHYQQAIYVNEHNYFARNRLASLLRESGDFDGAKTQYNKALHSWPAFTNAHRNLGILLDLYLGETNEALKHYKVAFQLDKLNKVAEDRKLKGWIADLSRRVIAINKRLQHKQ